LLDHLKARFDQGPTLATRRSTFSVEELMKTLILIMVTRWKRRRKTLVASVFDGIRVVREAHVT
jgi:hypothetical protein